jgi:ubiquinone/menaquinone biosynthesis C-methylase UbiE
MTPLEFFVLILITLFVVWAALYWLLISTEGVYLGPRVVAWLYDIYARRYDGIKKYDAEWEEERLARPILKTLAGLTDPLVLDVATGTARLPLALFACEEFEGHIIGLDYSRRMLTVAAEKLAPFDGRIELIYERAEKLPFEDDTFDVVTCLEALEFTMNPDAVIAELVRVAKPGSLILISNRKGRDARLMPGKIISRPALIKKLQTEFGLEDVMPVLWQVDYDQIWAFKPGELLSETYLGLESILRCPQCRTRAFIRVSNGLLCSNCEARIPIGPDRVIDVANVSQGSQED